VRRSSVPALLLLASLAAADDRPVVRSARSGPWEAADTWAGGKAPSPGETVLIRPGHRVVYGGTADKAYRSIHVGGTLAFDPDRDTLLAVGLLKVQPGENTAEEGFDCDAHIEIPKDGEPKPALEIGTSEHPVRKSAVIRLTYFEGMNKDSLPALICCGGRMDLHGMPLSRTWVKLGANVKKGGSTVTISEAVTGWKVGDKVIVTGTKDPDEQNGVRYTEEATIKAIDGTTVDRSSESESVYSGSGESAVRNRPCSFEYASVRARTSTGRLVSLM